jgi:hypothetical protein
MKSPNPPNVTADGSPGYMDLNVHEKCLQDAMLLLQTGRADDARQTLENALTHVQYYTVRRRIIQEQQRMLAGR